MKKILLTIATAFAAGALFLAFRYSEKLTPEAILEQWFDMNAPTRFAFVSDEQSKKLAVVDIEVGRQAGLLTLHFPARTMAIEKTTGTLAYSDGGKVVILHNLTSHQEREIIFSHPVQKIIFSSYSELIAIGKDAVSMFSLAEKTAQGRKIFPREQAEGEQVIITSAVFSPLNQSLWLLERRKPALQQIDLRTGNSQHFPLPHDWQHFSPLAISPDGEFLLFGGQKERNFAALWSVSKAQVMGTFPLSAPLMQPYIDQNSKRFILIDHHGKGFMVQSKNLNATAIDTNMPVSGYASVWLDQKLLVIGKQVKLFQLSDFKILDQETIADLVGGLFIHGNSKEAIFGAKAAPIIYIYRSGEKALQRITLNGIQQARQITMGSNNTICH